MGNIVQAEANAILEASVTGASYTPPSGAVKLALVTSNGTNTTAGTEVSGGGYARQDTTGKWGSASGGQISNSDSISFANMPAVADPGVVGIELWDSAATPVRRWFGALTASKIINEGDTVTFTPGSIVIQLS